MKKIHYNLLLFSILFLVSSQKSIAQDFINLPNGVSYAILEKGNSEKKLVYDKFVNFHIEVKTDLGKVLENSFTTNSPKRFVPVKPKQFEGDPSEIFQFLAEGDSAVCKVPMALLKQRFGGNLEQVVGGSNFMVYTFKILKVLSKQELEIAKQEEKAKQLAKFETQKKLDDEKIQAYLKQNNLEAQKTSSGLYYIIKQEGISTEPTQVGTDVNVHYIGKLLNGKLFDTSREEEAKNGGVYNAGRDYSTGFTFPLGKGRVIKGWDEGVALMSKGSRYLFILPSHLGYGARGAGKNIPPNSVLIFDIEVL